MRYTRAAVLFFLLPLIFSLMAQAQCTGSACTEVVNNGPDSSKKIIAVMGDGYATADQTKYNNDVQTLVTDGVLGHDFFREDNNGFNVYRLNLISVDSGVSQRVYDEHGTPTDGSDDTITSTTMKNTALGYIWSGSWAHCWLEGSANTGTLVQNALTTNLSRYDASTKGTSGSSVGHLKRSGETPMTCTSMSNAARKNARS
jgi:hypothetical protein